MACGRLIRPFPVSTLADSSLFSLQQYKQTFSLFDRGAYGSLRPSRSSGDSTDAPQPNEHAVFLLFPFILVNYTSTRLLLEQTTTPTSLNQPIDVSPPFSRRSNGADGDGTINTEEFGAVFRSLGHNLSEATLQQLVEDGDIDKNGKLDFKDFLSTLTSPFSRTVSHLSSPSYSLFRADSSPSVFSPLNSHYRSTAEDGVLRR
jgi:hypothetical protein